MHPKTPLEFAVTAGIPWVAPGAFATTDLNRAGSLNRRRIPA